MQDESQTTRASLLSKAKQRDSVAWNDLVQLYGPLVAHWCRRCGLSQEQVADGVQEVFINVLRSLPSFQSRREEGAFRAWLWRITHNKVCDLYRSNRNQPQARGGSSALADINAIRDDASIPESEPTDARALSELIARGLDQVRAEFETKTWEIFQRSIIDQIPTDIVAKQFNVSASTVRQVRSRVLRRLRIQLGELE